MRIVIVGPGALGSLLSTRIFLALRKHKHNGADNDDHSLYLLDYKTERAALLNENGLFLEDRGRTERCRLKVTADPGDIGPCDVLFLCVKANAVASALAHITPLLSRETLLIAMQNGIGHLDTIQGAACITAVAVTSEGATLIKTGHVRHGGSGVTRIGLMRAGNASALKSMEETTRLLNEAGMQSAITDHPLRHIWAKLFVNVGINALTAIHRRTNGQLLTSKPIRAQMRKAVREAELVARAKHITITDDPVASTFKVCRSTRDNISSMLQDVLQRRPTEINAINGAVVAEGKRLNIATPVNRHLVRKIKDIEASYRPHDSERTNTL